MPRCTLELSDDCKLLKTQSRDWRREWDSIRTFAGGCAAAHAIAVCAAAARFHEPQARACPCGSPFSTPLFTTEHRALHNTRTLKDIALLES